MDLNQALGQAIKELRVARKLSQESIGASQSYVSDIERGLKSLSVEKLAEFSQRLGVHPVTVLMKCYLLIDSEQTISSLTNAVHAELNFK